MKLLYISLLILTSCTTTRYIDRERVTVDSTAVHQRDSIQRVKTLDSAAYVNMIESLSENTIIFRDTGRVEIIYRPDGSIEAVRGQVRTLNTQLSRSESQTGHWKRSYDSLLQVSARDSIQVQRETVTVTKNTRTRFLPWWVWLAIAGGFVLGWKFGPRAEGWIRRQMDRDKLKYS